MTEIVVTQIPDSIAIELRPDEQDRDMWTLLAHLAEYLWTNYGVEFDCSTVIVHLVYGPAAGAEGSAGGTESPTR